MKYIYTQAFIRFVELLSVFLFQIKLRTVTVTVIIITNNYI